MPSPKTKSAPQATAAGSDLTRQPDTERVQVIGSRLPSEVQRMKSDLRSSTQFCLGVKEQVELRTGQRGHKPVLRWRPMPMPIGS